MGSPLSKPRSSRHNLLKDSIVLSDGLPRLREPNYAGSADGRYVFIIGDKTATAFRDGLSYDQIAFTFRLDVIDFFLSKRIRIRNIGDLYGIGHVVGFYALNGRQVVLVDFDATSTTLRQRLIQIDLRKETADCSFYRNYAMGGEHLSVGLNFHGTLIGTMTAKTSIGAELAVTVFPNREFEQTLFPFVIQPMQPGIVYPANPLSKKYYPSNISGLIQDANSYVAHCYAPGDLGPAKICTIRPPIFISDTVLAFFIDTNRSCECIDPMTLLEVDLDTDIVRLREASSTFFPAPEEQILPFYASWSQANNGEVALLTRYRSPWCWQVVVENILCACSLPFAKLCVFLSQKTYYKLADLVYIVVMASITIRFRILQTRPMGVALLSPSTLKYIKIKEDVRSGDTVIPLGDGHFVIASVTNDVSTSRLIGSGRRHKKMERFSLIRSPFRLPSLGRLSSIEVPKFNRVPIELLQQIAARIL